MIAVLTKWNSSCMALYVCKENNFALKKAGILPQTYMLYNHVEQEFISL